MANDKKNSLDAFTREDYRNALATVQAELAGCIGNLLFLCGYLESDLSLDEENSPYALLAARDIAHAACDAIKKSLSLSYPMV